ncbi:hypothetical protein B0T11DRAFT_347438 [Plectosphaerella cucumerina]|uniref:Uncharacterized protein n=1 Tax=Plectosphaerella cucumerina TaxID=40658 RepID=A0A8K0XAR8_9PEZI|nr:hypothetical protein B0T11DRAFT_347438 [Plectosphaerella cucumerina]
MTLSTSDNGAPAVFVGRMAVFPRVHRLCRLHCPDANTHITTENCHQHAPRQRSREDKYDSDDSFTPEEPIFNVNVEDLADLLDGVHPPEYYRCIAEDVNDGDLDAQDYSPGTEALLSAVEDHWKCFYKTNGFGDPDWRLESIKVSILKSFFTWRLDLKAGKGGRRIKGIKNSSSLGTTWKVFRLVYERAVAAKLDSKLNRQMHKVLRKLAEERGLSDKTRENRCMTIDDLKEQIETTVGTTKKSFYLGELRTLAVLFLLLLAPAGARPQAILRLRFRDMRVVLARDPEGGPHKLRV